MHYALICTDKPNSLQLRLDTRPTHLKYLESLGQKLVFSGPFLDAEGKPNGSLVMVDAESPAAAKAMADADPYAKAGLFASVEIRAWRAVFNHMEKITVGK